MHTELWTPTRQAVVRMRAYDAADGGAAVVVLHGLGVSVDIVAEVLPDLDPFAALRDLGFHVLAVDWPGHGRSGGRRGHLTYRSAMDAAAAAVETALNRWRTPVVLLGAGLGGVLAFYAALEDSRVSAVASAGLLDLRDVRPAIGRTRRAAALPAAGLVSRVTTPAVQERVAAPLAAVLSSRDLAEDPDLARRLRRHPQAVAWYSLATVSSIFAAPEGKPDVQAQTTPVLAAVGGRDRVLPETGTRALVQRLTCPAELWVLQGGGHQLLLEHPRALLPVAADFFRRHTSGLSSAD